MFLEIQHLYHRSDYEIGTNAHAYVQQRAYFFLNEGIPYGARIAMAICVILISIFHKILLIRYYMRLGLFYNIKAVWHKYQSMPNISNLFGF